MRNISRKPGLLFFLSCIFIFSIILPTNNAYAASSPKKWSRTVSGQSLFSIPQKDSSLLVGNYEIINNVYKLDIMTIDSKGKKKSAWKFPTPKKGRPEILLGGSEKTPVIYKVVQYGKGLTYAYNSKGKVLWKKELGADNNTVWVNELGNLVYTKKGKLISYSTSGKRILYMTIPTFISYGEKRQFESFNFQFLKTGEFILLNRGDEAKPGKLVFFSAKGKKLWEKSILSKETDTKYLWNNTSDGPSIISIDDKKNIYVKFDYNNPMDENNYNDDVEYSKIFAVSAKGKKIWSVKTKQRVWSNFAVVNNGRLMIPSDLNFYIVSKKGNLFFQKPLIKNNTDIYENKENYYSITFDQSGNMYIFSKIPAKKKTYLTKFDSLGKQIWKKNIKANIDDYYNLEIAGNKLLAYSSGRSTVINVYTLSGKVEKNIGSNIKNSTISNVTFDEKQNILYVSTTKAYKVKNVYKFKTTITSYKIK
jgi:hypothetical protein